MKSKRYLRIELFDSENLLWSRDVLAHRFKKDRLGMLMRVLAGRSLSPDEILGCFASEKRGKPPVSSLLEIRNDTDLVRRTVASTCGENPYVVVSSIEY